MSHKGKTAAELQQLRVAKAAEVQTILEVHEVEQDGKITYDLTPQQFDDLRERMHEINEISRLRDEALELEQMMATVKSIQESSREPVRPMFDRPNFPPLEH